MLQKKSSSTMNPISGSRRHWTQLHALSSRTQQGRGISSAYRLARGMCRKVRLKKKRSQIFEMKKNSTTNGQTGDTCSYLLLLPCADPWAALLIEPSSLSGMATRGQCWQRLHWRHGRCKERRLAGEDVFVFQWEVNAAGGFHNPWNEILLATIAAVKG
jgi:hypothetical protein